MIQFLVSTVLTAVSDVCNVALSHSTVGMYTAIVSVKSLELCVCVIFGGKVCVWFKL